jgi:hypothetical protein
MDRRELFGIIGGLGTVPLCSSSGGAHEAGKPGEGPINQPHLHFCGIHMAKSNPKLQFITQHYCAAHTGGPDGDVFQCVLYDGNGKNAKLIGIEYLISDAAYRKLPEAEKRYWHPHTYEVLGGGLIAPGMEPKEELAFMKVVMTTWGKAWHTWPDPSSPVPVGEPLLIWSLMGDGQVDEKLLATRDRDYKVDTAKVRETRIKELGLEVPQVAVPKDVHAVGRQWTNEGEDKPTPKKKAPQ